MHRSCFLLALLSLSCNNSDFNRGERKSAIPQTDSFIQESYEPTTSTFKQGVAPKPNQQVVQQTNVLLDLLIVVDNSRSMTEEQQNLSTKLGPLLSQIQDVDWQISVVTTGKESNEDCFRDLIQKTNPNYEQAFANAVSAGNDGYTYEFGFRNALLGLQGQCPGQTPWIRDGSTVSVLFVSDEDNCSEGTCPDGVDWGANLVSHIQSIRRLGETARFYGLIWEPGTVCREAHREGYTYSNVIQNPLGLADPGATAGKIGSICSEDYTPTLEAISADIAHLIKSKIPLDQVPDPDTLTVLVDGNPWEQYTVEGQEVVFSEIPPALSEITLDYTYGSEGELIAELPLEHPPVDGSISISINGDKLATTEYEYSKDDNKIVFQDQMPDLAAINLDYEIQADLPDTFPVHQKAITDSFKVDVEGENFETEITHDEDNHTITLDPAPPPGAAFDIIYKRAG